MGVFKVSSDDGKLYLECGYTPGDEPVYEVARLFGEHEIKRSLFHREVVHVWTSLRDEPIEVVLNEARVERTHGRYWHLSGVTVSDHDGERGRQIRIFVIAGNSGGGVLNGGSWQFKPESPVGNTFRSIDVE